jgi:hypothetical protein
MSKNTAADEYHLICRTTGESHGGFENLGGARQYAREEGLEAWDIFHGNLLVERHEPRRLEFTERKYRAPPIRLPAGFGVGEERRKRIKRGSPPN